MCYTDRSVNAGHEIDLQISGFIPGFNLSAYESRPFFHVIVYTAMRINDC